MLASLQECQVLRATVEHNGTRLLLQTLTRH